MAAAAYTRRITIILLLGLLIRLVNIGQSFWLDEAAQAIMSQNSISWILFSRGGDFHPPLFYLFSHLLLLFTHSEVWLRFPSVVFSLLTIWITYLLGIHISADGRIRFFRFSFSYAEVAAFFVAVNPFLVYYSQEFRAYSLLGFLGAWSMYALLTRRFFWLAVINSLLLYTHYSSFFLLVSQYIYVFIYARGDIKKYLVSQIISLVLFLPWLPQFFTQLNSGVNIDQFLPGWRNLLSVSPFKIAPLTFFKLVAGRITFLSNYLYYAYIVFVLMVTFISFRFLKKSKEFLLNWAFVPLLAMIVLSFLFPQNQPFRIIYIVPALSLIFAQAVFRFPRLFLTFLIYIALVGNVTYFTRPRLQREQWRQSVASLNKETSSQNGVAVVKFVDRFAPLYWYQPAFKVAPALTKFPAAPEDVASQLSSQLITTYSNVYLFDYLGELTDPHRQVDLWLENQGFTKEKTINFEGVGFIHKYSR